MAKLSRYTLLPILWSAWTVPLSFSEPDQPLSEPLSSLSFEEDLLRINGDRYVMEDIAGEKRHDHVGNDTEIFSQVKSGDRIQLWVQPDGRARTIIIARSGRQ